jgi:RHS repeat-associated protein
LAGVALICCLLFAEAAHASPLTVIVPRQLPPGFWNEPWGTSVPIRITGGRPPYSLSLADGRPVTVSSPWTILRLQYTPGSDSGLIVQNGPRFETHSGNWSSQDWTYKQATAEFIGPYGQNVSIRHTAYFEARDAAGTTAGALTDIVIRWDTSKYGILGYKGDNYRPRWRPLYFLTELPWRDQYKAISVSATGSAASDRLESRPLEFDTPLDKAGGAVHLSTGAEIFERELISVAGAFPFGIAAGYHSLLGPSKNGPLGYGWKHNFELSLTPSQISGGNPNTLTLRRKWSVHEFVDLSVASASSSRKWSPAGARPGDEYIERANGGTTWILHTHDRHKYYFPAGSETTFVTAIESPDGKFLDLTYEGTKLTTVTDRLSGRSALFTYDGEKIVGVTDDSGLQSAVFEYDAAGMISRLAIGGQGYTYEYDENGWMTTVKDALGMVVTQNTYDNLGRVIQQEDARSDNLPLLFSYDEATRPSFVVTTKTDRAGAKHEYVFDSNFWLLREYTSPTGEKTRFTYDAEGRLASTTSPDGVTRSHSHDFWGNRTGGDLPGGAQQTLAYDERNQLTSATDSLGRTTSIEWSSNGLALSVSNSVGIQSLFNYDADGLIESIQDQSGAQVRITNSGGLPQVVVSPTGEQTAFAYDGAGRVVSATSPGSRVTSLAYDPRGLVTNTTYPDGTFVSVGYDHRQRATNVTGPSGSVSMSYDGNHNLMSRTDQLGRTTQFAYDGEDRPTSVNLPGGRSISMTYDASGRVVTATDPAGRVRKNEYDAAGRLAKVLFPATNSQPLVAYSYNPEGFVSAVTDGDGNVQRMGYDALGRVTSLTNAAGAVTQFSYDQLGRLTNTVSPAGRITSVRHNDGTRTSVTTDANANATTLTYDASGRLSSVTTQSGATTQYGYDSNGDLQRIVEPSGQQANLTYDSAGRVQSVSDPAGTVSYAYDSAGRLHTISEGTNTITRLYDALGRLTNYTDAFGNQIGYTYNLAGDLECLTYPDGTQVRYEYNAAGQVAKITDWDGRVTTYTYNASGRMQSMQRPNGTSRTQTYWNSGRLKTAAESGPDAVYSWNYAYGPTGLLTNEARLPSLPAPPTQVPVAFSYGSDNRLSTVGGQSVNFDADGNMTLGPLGNDGSLQAFGYDARNRLTNAGGISYAYDAENRRVSMTTAAGQTRFAIDSWSELDRVLVMRHPDESTTKFVHGPGLLYSRKGNEVRFHHFDYRGSAVILTDGAGVVTDTFRYGSYGELISRTGTSQTPFQFVGQHGVQTDPSGLIHMRARYYSTFAKRFINQDILLGESENAVSMNRFAYGNGDPVALIDPLGLAAENAPKIWAAEETKALLAAERGPLWWDDHLSLPWHRKPRPKDTKLSRKLDKFIVDSATFNRPVLLDAAQWGNFSFAYKAYQHYGPVGYLFTRLGGIVYDATENYATAKWDWDEDSHGDLRDGALTAAGGDSRGIDLVDYFIYASEALIDTRLSMLTPFTSVLPHYLRRSK